MIRTDEAAIAYSTARLLVRQIGAELGRGLDISATDQFEEVWAELIANSSKGRVNDESSPFASDLNSGNTSYIVVRNDEGQIDAFVSVRLIELGASTLSIHLRRQFRRIYGAGREAIDLSCIAPILNEISGRAAFISDVFIDKPLRNVMPQSVMTILAQSLSVLRWQPDWIYGFSKDRDVKRGLAGKYYSSRSYPGALKWLVETPNRLDSDWLLCWDRSDYSHTLRYFTEEFEDQWTVERSEYVRTR